MQMLYPQARYVILCLLVLFSIQSKSQTGINNELVIDKLATYSKSHPSVVLFIHTDKTLYTNNETIWFRAYLLPEATGDLQEHSFLAVSLAREDTREVVLHDNYLMSNGLSFGSISLPDSIAPGNYQFIASTNIVDKAGKPVAVFEQSLTIKSITQQEFDFALDLLDTVPANGIIRALVNVSVTDIKDKSRPVLEYRVGVDKNKPVI